MTACLCAATARLGKADGTTRECASTTRKAVVRVDVRAGAVIERERESESERARLTQRETEDQGQRQKEEANLRGSKQRGRETVRVLGRGGAAAPSGGAAIPSPVCRHGYASSAGSTPSVAHMTFGLQTSAVPLSTPVARAQPHRPPGVRTVSAHAASPPRAQPWRRGHG